MTVEDTRRQIAKTLDVLRRVEDVMLSEARMNVGKHMSETVHPTPLAAAVSATIRDLEFWDARLA